MKWETIKLSDCCASIADGDHQPPPKSEQGVPFVTIANINSYNEFDFSDTMFVPQEYYDRLDGKRKAQIGDVLYSVVGSFGIPVLIKDNTRFVFQRHIAILRPDTSIILPEFLYYTMLSRDFYAEADAVALGAAQRTISLTSLRNISINIPAIDYQKKIISILSSYDHLIKNNQKQIKLLEEAAQRLYKEWFIDLRFPGHETTPIVKGNPEGWIEKRFNELFSFVRGKSYTSKELSEKDGILMVNLKSIRPFGGFRRNQEKHYIGKYNEDQILEPGDIVMGVTDMTKERRLVGHVAIVPDLHEKATFSMDLIKLTPFSVPKSYLYSVIHFGGLSTQISQLANGVNVLHLKPETMMNMSILCPSDKIISEYDKLFNTTQKKIETLQKECDLAVEARDRLLPKLMSGEIEV